MLRVPSLLSGATMPLKSAVTGIIAKKQDRSKAKRDLAAAIAAAQTSEKASRKVSEQDQKVKSQIQREVPCSLL